MDLRFSTFPTPIGTAFAVASDAGLRSLDFGVDLAGARTVQLGAGREARRADAALEPVAEQLAEYFDGARRTFEVGLDLDGIGGFTRDALEAIIRIPYGETAGYGEVAVLAGRPRAARAVGTACARTPISVVIPAHRVVRADGSLGEYGGRPEIKRFLRDLESSTVAAD